MMEQIPATVAGAAVWPLAEVRYSPALLLDAHLDASLTDSSAFRQSCACGFDTYFESMAVWDATQTRLLVVEQPTTWAEVVAVIVQTALRVEGAGSEESPASRTGFLLGWLSAFALSDQGLARLGLVLMQILLADADGKRAA